MHAKGYIRGETLRALKGRNEKVVIGTWSSLDDWRRWESDQERRDIQSQIDRLLRAAAVQRMFVYE